MQLDVQQYLIPFLTEVSISVHRLFTYHLSKKKKKKKKKKKEHGTLRLTENTTLLRDKSLVPNPH